MNHLIITQVQVLVDDDVADVDLGDHFEGCVPLLLWSALLMLILDIDDIFDGSLRVNPELVVGSINYDHLKIFDNKIIFTCLTLLLGK